MWGLVKTEIAPAESPWGNSYFTHTPTEKSAIRSINPSFESNIENLQTNTLKTLYKASKLTYFIDYLNHLLIYKNQLKTYKIAIIVLTTQKLLYLSMGATLKLL